MIILLGLIALTILGMILLILDFEIIGGIITIAGMMFLFVALIGIPPKNYRYHNDIQIFKSVELSINNARINNIGLENAALQLQVIEANKWLASAQYWNSTIFDIYVPDEVDDLKQIK